ncbi:hypothetical protein LTR66_016443 [Elasticomyces elasticus]|nr:hypothetical protein LTR66_016443 [Elasticomyces elasticus]
MEKLESPPERSSWTRHLCSSIGIDWHVELELLLLTFATGMQDAISFPDFHCFASNQTGNTVILAVASAGLGHGLFDIANIGVSLAMFLAGAIITGQLAHFVGPRRRAWLLLSHLMQTAMAFGAGVIQLVYGERETGPTALGALTLLAFSSGAQVASMRPLRIQEITTAMATAAWVDLVIDPDLLTMKNHPRNRRAWFLVALVAGSFAGGFSHKDLGSAYTLLIAAAGKALVLLGLFFNRSVATEPSEKSKWSLKCAEEARPG